MVSVFRPFVDRDIGDCPVIFCADGQAVPGFAPELLAAIRAGEVPPVVLIGVHSHPVWRAREYLDHLDTERFADHEQFFVAEVSAWGRDRLKLNLERAKCAVFGFSNGGALALSLGAKYRDRFGAVIAFSIAGGPHRVPANEYNCRPIPKYYLSAGTREKPFLKTVRTLGKILGQHGVEYCQTERCAGHDFAFWNAEFRLAIGWAFRG